MNISDLRQDFVSAYGRLFKDQRNIVISGIPMIIEFCHNLHGVFMPNTLDTLWKLFLNYMLQFKHVGIVVHDEHPGGGNAVHTVILPDDRRPAR